MEQRIIRKISARHVVGNVQRLAPRPSKDGKLPTEVVPLFRVYGVANAVRRGESDFGPWIAFVGTFEAVPLVQEEGEEAAVYIAPQCFLPEPTASLIAAELEARDGAGKAVVSSIEFAFEIGLKASEVPIGYEYTCKPLMNPGGADPLANLRSKMSALPPPGEKAKKAAK